jgi:putative ABC transport system permease protein
MREWWMTLRALATRSRSERELAEELDFHQAMQAARHRATGLAEEDAARRARRDFGSLAWVADACRDVRGISFFESVWRDLGHGLRSFRRTPTFALTVIATVGLGLGLNTAVFSVFNAYVLKPLPIQDPFSVYSFTWMNRAGYGHRFTWPEYQAFRSSNDVFANTFASRKQFISRIDGVPAVGELVTGEYFRMLGVGATLGRPLVPDDSSAPEIGLRMALGATARSVHELIVGQLARLAVWGLLVGVVASLALSRVLASVIALVEPFDAVAYGLSVAVLFATCLAAAYVPAAHAARIDPMNTLRHD